MEKAILKDGLKEKVKLYLEENEKDLRGIHNSKRLPGRALAEKRSKVIDELIIQSLTGLGFSKMPGVSIVALGGYGRRELCPKSDVDLLFLYSQDSLSLAKEAEQNLLYLLWDLSLDIGHSTRTIDECMGLARGTDLTIPTALLDGRFIMGDRRLYDKFDKKLYRDLLPEIAPRYIERKIEENEKRIERFGRSVYILEPHVKEGEGGLRDIHSALWIAKAKFKARDFQELLEKCALVKNELGEFYKGLDFLIRIRSELHYLAGRRDDRLSFEWQEKIAGFLGYKPQGEIPAVERFMRAYYLRANLTREYSKKLIERCAIKPKAIFRAPKTVPLDNGFMIREGTLSVSNRNLFKEAPENLIRAFEYADRYGLGMSKFLTDLIQDNVRVIDDSVRRGPKFNSLFLKFLQEGKGVSKALFEMNRLRLLGRYIPEFGDIVCMVQHDAYHVYTVDIHSIFMVKEIESLIHGKYEKEFPLLARIAKGVTKRHVLYLSCLFHDMGKGEGRNHAQRGAVMATQIAERMGLSEEETEQLEFLVKHHLIMPHFSQRRDVHDESLIFRFAKSVRTLETLSLLYLLTFADIRSVGPDVWTNWKGMLLEELYLRTAGVLRRGEFKRELPEEKAAKSTAKVVQILRSEIPEDRTRMHLENMPNSYFMGFSPDKISYHLRLIERFREGTGTDVVFYPDEGYDEFTFWGYDEPGIFSRLCGVIAGNGINILGARIITRNDGRILDVFYVNRLGKSTYEGKEMWDKVNDSLHSVLRGEINVEELVAKRKKYKPIYEKSIPKDPTRVETDNESSDLATVIDVYTHDRVGLLYDITKTLTRLGLSIDYAKISTKVDQVADIFYVREIDGGKVFSPEKLKEIESALSKAIDVEG
ncbi:MAG TPA: [protein-PII] uridylyltransferase [Thermodesulfobacteriota bacterium]|nr:[protein-PII] uridylyltransferase [Thermodesulfobacteriota bacterium]